MSKLAMLLLCAVLAMLPAAVVVSQPSEPRAELFNRLERYEEALQCYEQALHAQEKAHQA